MNVWAASTGMPNTFADNCNLHTRFPYMQKTLLLITAFLALTACKKTEIPAPTPEPPSELRYVDLGGYVVHFGGAPKLLDIDQDGQDDMLLGYRLVGDPLYRVDKKQWLAVTDIRTRLAVNGVEQSPMLRKQDLLPVESFGGYTWYAASSIILMERVEDIASRIQWNGSFRDADRHYLPIQQVRNGLRYNGWVELSADTAGQRLILHRAAIARTGERPVVAGQ